MSFGFVFLITGLVTVATVGAGTVPLSVGTSGNSEVGGLTFPPHGRAFLSPLLLLLATTTALFCVLFCFCWLLV